MIGSMYGHSDHPDGRPATLSAELDAHVSALLKRVPRHGLRLVIDEIDRMSGGNSAMGRRLKAALIERFNQLRPHKARRLFTGLFEPILIDDPILVRAVDPVPGLLLRADAGGVWVALNQLAIPDLLLEVQARLDELSQDMIIDKVLEGAEALTMRERMRAAAAAFLVSLPSRRRVLDSFLQAANRAALKEAKNRFPDLVHKSQITPLQLSFIADVLNHSAVLLPEIETFRKIVEKPPRNDNEIYRQAKTALVTSNKLRSLCPDLPPDHPVLNLPVLLLLNISQRFEVVTKFLSLINVSDSAEALAIGRTVTGHLVGACRTIVNTLRPLLPPPPEVGVEPPDPDIILPTAQRDLLNLALTRFEMTFRFMHTTELGEERRGSMQVREHMNDLATLLTGSMSDLAVYRASVAAFSHLGPSHDHEDVVWLLDFIRRWGLVLASQGYSSQEIYNLRDRVGEDVSRAFRQAVRSSGSGPAESQMAHLVRLNQLMRAVGGDVGRWVSAVSQNTQRIVRHYLERLDEPSDDERFVIDQCMHSIYEELDKSRFWQNPDLLDLLRIYQRRWGVGEGFEPR